MHLTPTAESALHTSAASASQLRHQIGEAEQVVGSEWATTCSHRDERILGNYIGPTSRQRVLDAGASKKNTLFSPQLWPTEEEQELPTRPWMERVGHPKGSGLTVSFEKSRQRGRKLPLRAR